MNRSDETPPVVFDFYKRKDKPQEDYVASSTNTLAEDLEKIYSSKKLQIVILDLDVKSMSTLSSLLKSRYDVHCCTSPLEAMRLIGTKKIALVISEQALPNLNMSGYDFIKKAKTIAPLTERILLAGPLDFGKAKYSLEKGDVFKLVKKPFDEMRLLELVDAAMERYLDQSGGLAAAAAKMNEHAPNMAKKITIAKTIPPSANPVVVQCSDKSFFEDLKENYPEKAFFIHSTSKEETIKTLEANVAKAWVYCFDKAEATDDEVLFLEQVKGELPHLSIMVIMSKDGANYQQIMNLLTNKVIYTYLPFNTKPEKIYQQLVGALDLANRLYMDPVYLVWPPLERFEPEDEDSITDTLKDVSLKVKEGVLSKFETMKGIFKKKNS